MNIYVHVSVRLSIDQMVDVQYVYVSPFLYIFSSWQFLRAVNKKETVKKPLNELIDYS